MNGRAPLSRGGAMFVVTAGRPPKATVPFLLWCHGYGDCRVASLLAMTAGGAGVGLGWFLPVWILNVPLALAEHRRPTGGPSRALFEHGRIHGNASSGAPVGRGAQGTGLFLRGERCGCAFFGDFLCTSKESHPPAGRDPQLGVNSRAGARSTRQS